MCNFLAIILDAIALWAVVTVSKVHRLEGCKKMRVP
jgi:hypothetical protein